MALILLVCISCASAPAGSQPYSAEEIVRADDAIRQLLIRTSTAAPENMFVTKANIGQLSVFLPPTAQGIVSELSIIPGFQNDCQKWLDTVNSICASVALTIPDLLEEPIAQLQIPDPQAIVEGSTTSTTSLLDTAFSEQLTQSLYQSLKERLDQKDGDEPSADELWNRIINKYNIWRMALSNLSYYSGKEVPQEISGDIAEHLAQLINDMFFTQMAIEEDSIRTTPRPQDNSLIAEVFTIPLQ